MIATSQKTTGTRICWQLWQAAFLGCGTIIVFTCVYLFITPAALRLRPPVYLSYYQTSLLSSFITTVCTALIITPVVWLMCRGALDDFLDSVGWNGKPNFSVYVGAIGAGCILALGIHFGGRWFPGGVGHVSRSHLSLTLFLYVLSSVLLIPILEEFYFRGILFVSLSPRLGRLYAIIVVTVLFSGIHVGHRFGVLPTATVLGFVRLRTNSLACCFVLHASYNFFLFWLALLVSPS